MHQPFSTYFASLVSSIVARSPDADLWLLFNSICRKSVIHVLSLMGAVWYSVPSRIFAWISLQFG